LSDDREAARAVLNERAFAYVEAVEDERDELRRQLESRPTTPDFERIAQAAIIAGMNLEAAAKAARLNLNAAGMRAIPATNSAAAYRNLDEGLIAFTQAIGKLVALNGSILLPDDTPMP
jgi:hypothetical protein